MKIKIRGIYATALTKFFKDRGYEIVNLSEEMKKRMKEDGEEADTIISDQDDKNGVIVTGKNAKEISEIMRDEFDGVMNSYNIGDIYVGKIKRVDQRKGIIYVNIGEREGILYLNDYFGFTRIGEKILVQIKHNSRIPILTTKLRIFGDDAIIIKDGYNNVSRYIKDENEKERLIQIKKIDGWGILWKSTAENKPSELLINEINKLMKKEEEIKKKFEETDEPKKIADGMKYYTIEFGANSKIKLDKIRSLVINTIKGHHMLKSSNYGLLVDFAEKVGSNSIEALNETLKEVGPRKGMLYEILHKKMNGENIYMKGIIKEVNEKEITIKREFKPIGIYDGLEIPKEKGDYGITHIYPLSWFIVHEYFNREGELKGKYININTPVEVFPKFCRYIDLEVDLIEINGKRKMIDVEKLEEAKKEGKISQKYYDFIIQKANDLLIGGDMFDRRKS